MEASSTMTSWPWRSRHRSSSAPTWRARRVMARVRSEGLAPRSLPCREASSARRWSCRPCSVSHLAVFSVGTRKPSWPRPSGSGSHLWRGTSQFWLGVQVPAPRRPGARWPETVAPGRSRRPSQAFAMDLQSAYGWRSPAATRLGGELRLEFATDSRRHSAAVGHARTCESRHAGPRSTEPDDRRRKAEN
jgi:hypothetical protein